MNNIFLDIETIPNQSPEYRAKVRAAIKPPGNISKPDSIAKWMDENAESATDEAVAKTGLDPAAGHICSIAWAVGDGEVHHELAPTLEEESWVLHRFFDQAAAKVQVKDIEGNYSSPKEWFSVPLETIEVAVRLLISGEIVSYRYDSATGQVMLHS